MIKKACIIALLLSSEITLASQWDDFWLRRDQQGQKLLEQKNYAAAADRFEDPRWQGAAQYRAGQFEQAAQKFSQDSSARSQYNYGNALAQQGRLAEALQAYDRALQQQPHFPDAQFNRNLVEEAMKNQSDKNSKDQQQQQNQSQNQNQNQNQNQQSESKQGKQGDNKQDNQSEAQKQQNAANNKPQNSTAKNEGDKNENQKSAASPENNKNNGEKNAASENRAEKNNNNEQHESTQKQGSENAKSDQKAAEQQKPSAVESAESLDKGQQGSEEALSGQELSNQQREKNDLQQWLQKIPDDPAGLLRRKFWRDHQRRQWDQQG